MNDFYTASYLNWLVKKHKYDNETIERCRQEIKNLQLDEQKLKTKIKNLV